MGSRFLRSGALPRQGRILATALVQTGYCEEVFFTVGTSKITNNARTWYGRGVVGRSGGYRGRPPGNKLVS